LKLSSDQASPSQSFGKDLEYEKEEGGEEEEREALLLKSAEEGAFKSNDEGLKNQ